METTANVSRLTKYNNIEDELKANKFIFGYDDDDCRLIQWHATNYADSKF